MSYSGCIKCVSLRQKYERATRIEYDPNSKNVVKVGAHADRVFVRKAMIAHDKVCNDR